MGINWSISKRAQKVFFEYFINFLEKEKLQKGSPYFDLPDN